MLPISIVIPITFLVVVWATLGFFYLASSKSNFAIGVLLVWFLAQSMLGYSGFYTVANPFPPRVVFLVLPPIAFITILFLTDRGQRFIDALDLKWLTVMHVVRLPVEIVLYGLFLSKYIPQIMTFEGRNFDILMGISAPVVYYFSFVRKRLNRGMLLLWNMAGVFMVLNIAITGILSSPVAFQQFGFEQPNVAVLYFPFNLLPSLVVPMVLFSHFASIRQLIQGHVIAPLKEDGFNKL